jgi:hypothetical protein
MWVVCRIIIGIPAARTGRFNSTTPQAQEWRLSNVLRDKREMRASATPPNIDGSG